MLAIGTASLRALASVQLQALSSAQLRALSGDQIAALSSANVASLKVAQWGALLTNQLLALTSSNVSGLSSAQVGAFSSAQVGALATGAIAALSTSAIAGLGSENIVALSSAQVAALRTNALLALSTSQIAALETRDLMAIPATKLSAFSESQIAALRPDQLMALSKTPIVLDMNGDGVHTLSTSVGVQFDLSGIGRPLATGWVSPEDGLLVRDLNHNGNVDDGTELFGSSTVLPNGSSALDGFAALAALDTNYNGLIDAGDATFNELAVWVDENSDGISTPTEIRSLTSWGVTEINLNRQSAAIIDNGNVLGLVSSYKTSDGRTLAVADVWLDARPAATAVETVATMVQAIGEFSQGALQAGTGIDEGNGLLAKTIPSDGAILQYGLDLHRSLQNYAIEQTTTATNRDPSPALRLATDAMLTGKSIEPLYAPGNLDHLALITRK